MDIESLRDDKMANIVIDTEADWILELIEHFEKELDREYTQGVVRKGNRLVNSSALSKALLEGDEVNAVVSEKGFDFNVAMTLPVSELGGGYSYIKCSCGEDRLHLDENRCHHMWLVQKKVLEKLQKLTAKEEIQEKDGLFDALDQFLEEKKEDLPLKVEDDTPKQRLVWRIDSELDVIPYLQKRKSDGNWTQGAKVKWHEFLEDSLFGQSQKDQLIAARVKPKKNSLLGEYDIDFFGIIEDLASHPNVYWQDSSNKRVKIIEGQVGVSASVSENSIVALPNVNGKSSKKQYIFPEQGYVVVMEKMETIYFSRCDKKTTAFIQSLISNPSPVPIEEKERFLEYLVKLEERIPIDASAVLVADSSDDPDTTLYLRLTPLDPIGLRVEFLFKPIKDSGGGSYFPPGDGPERVLDIRDKKAPKSVIRDLREEITLARRIELSLGLDHFPRYANFVFYLGRDENALDLMSELESINDTYSIVVEWPKNAGKKYELVETPEKPQVEVVIKEGRDWFDVKGGIKLDDGTVLELRKLIEALKQNLRYIQLKDGKWAKVTETFQKRLNKINDIIEVSDEKLQVSAGSFKQVAELEEDESINVVESPISWEQLKDRHKRIDSLDLQVPDGFKGQLRSYQKIGFEWMCRLYNLQLGGCLADDMGLGKTIQTLALLLKYCQHGPSVIIAPTSLIYNWLNETRKFCPSLNPIIYKDTDRDKIIHELKSGDLLLATYGTVLNDIEKLQSRKWNVMVLDEAQSVKNSQAKTARAIKRLDANWKLGLSGTPIENNLTELWSLFHIISPQILASFNRFKVSYLIPIERYHNQDAAKKLKKMLSPFILRRLKKDCLKELPEKTEINRLVEIPESERMLYDAFRIDAIDSLDKNNDESENENEGKKRFAVLAALTKLRQIACHPRLVDENWTGDSAKLAEFRTVAKELVDNNHKALVFSQFTSFLELIRDVLQDMSIPFLYLDGGTSVRKGKTW